MAQDKALSSYEGVFEKTGILGTKIDLVLAIIRIGIFFGDRLSVKKNVDRAKTLVESGGDWDRRNRLKAYQGLHLLTTRSYNLAAPLLLDSLSTFTSYELCSYSSLVVYSVLAGSESLKRLDFKTKVVDAPEIRAILGDGEDKLSALSGTTPGTTDEEMKDASSTATPTPAPTAVNLSALGSSTAPQEVEAPVDFTPLAGLVRSLYNGHYQSFFLALAAVEENFLSQDRYLYEHRAWFVREMRLRGYQQLLQSYRVVGLGSMANDFGVSVDFLDRYVPLPLSPFPTLLHPHPYTPQYTPPSKFLPLAQSITQPSPHFSPHLSIHPSLLPSIHPSIPLSISLSLPSSKTNPTSDLAKFIAADRIPCTIDRVNKIIETNRPDDKNRQYADVVKVGDGLITKLQKYGQAVRLRGSERG
jgi:hypothetical protein